LQRAEEKFGQGIPDGLVFMPAVFETYGTPTKETLKLIHDLCDLLSHPHLHDAADRCAARHYWVRQVSNALAADLPWYQGRDVTAVEGIRVHIGQSRF
jgi:hypothetical protein